MIPDNLSFELFLRERMKDKNISLKKLSDLTGISLTHIEGFLRGDLEGMAPTPYCRGYLLRLGEVLDFDGEGWWEKIKKEGSVKRSGPQDTLPRNRFIRESPAKEIVIFVVAVAVLIYLVFELPRVLGKPVIALTSPRENPYSASSNIVILQGTTKNTDSLSVNGEEVTVGDNGSWQKNVLLQNGVNTFDIAAQKFLGGKTDMVEQIMYTAPVVTTSSSSSPSRADSAISSSTPAFTTTETKKK